DQPFSFKIDLVPSTRRSRRRQDCSTAGLLTPASGVTIYVTHQCAGAAHGFRLHAIALETGDLPRPKSGRPSMIRTMAILVAGTVISTSSAFAQSTTQSRCWRDFSGAVNCTSTTLLVQEPIAFCLPTLSYDRYGVLRYRYAHPGCEHGWWR